MLRYFMMNIAELIQTYGLMIIGIPVILIYMYFSNKEQNKAKEKHFELLNSLQIGDLVEIKDMACVVKEIYSEYVLVEISQSVSITIQKNLIIKKIDLK